MANEITRERWIAELIYGWKNRLSLRKVLVNLHDILDGVHIPPSRWEEMRLAASKMSPPILEYARLAQQVTSWMATNHVRTSELLWDGKIEKAVKMLMSNKDYSRSTVGSVIKKEIRSESRDITNSLRIKARSLSNSDWDKCK